jgi:DNA-binding NtrC family response regulator
VYVDDDASGRVVFEQTCGREFDVVTVADAASALAVLEARDAAVLLADLQMPGRGGEDLLCIARERHPRTIRIAITACADADRILRALGEGLVARHVVKPWQPAVLGQVVREACETWSLGGDVRMWLHDLRTPLTAILANAENLEMLAQSAPALRAAVERAAMESENRRVLFSILDELLPIAQDLAAATADLEQLIERLPFVSRERRG